MGGVGDSCIQVLMAREHGLFFLPAFPVFLWQWHVLLEEPLLLVVLLVLLVLLMLLLLMCRWRRLVVLLKVWLSVQRLRVAVFTRVKGLRLLRLLL